MAYKEGFFLQIAEDQYVLGKGPLCFSTQADRDKWSLFHPPFFYKGHPGAYWCIPSSVEVLSKKNILSLFKTKISHCSVQDWQYPSFSVFQNYFSQVLWEINQTGSEIPVIKEVFPSCRPNVKHAFSNHLRINQGKLKKIVPVFFETAQWALDESSTKALLYRLLSPHTESRAYAFWSDKKAIMGRTPELLFQKEGLNVQTMALAGTARDFRHHLLKDLKERQEHEWVVHEIKNTLSPIGDYSLSSPYIYSVGSLQHLRTDFKLKLTKDLSFQKLCSLLHPTPALGGFPKQQALKRLLKWEQKGIGSRYGFGAPFGVALNNKAFCLVAIRNAQFINGKVYIGSGCGLVQNSHITTEWQELKKKREVIKQMLFS